MKINKIYEGKKYVCGRLIGPDDITNVYRYEV